MLIGLVLVWMAALSHYDVRQRRLPDRLTLPGFGAIILAAVAALIAAKLVPLVFAAHGGTLDHDGVPVPISRTYATGRSVEVDALLLAGSPAEANARILLDETFRHLKPIAVLPQGGDLLATAGVSSGGAGIFVGSEPSSIVDSLVSALEQHRIWDRVVPT